MGRFLVIGVPSGMGRNGMEIFVSHSKDDPNLTFFQQAFATTAMKGGFMEWESVKIPPWNTIRNHVMNSRCVFVSLSRPLLDWNYQHTRNWIDFEVGLACMQNKHVWVFEPSNEPVNFAVPYCTHYVLYDPDSREHVLWLRQQIETYFPLLGPFIPHNRVIKCASERCGLSFCLMTDTKDFSCPSCRTGLTLRDQPNNRTGGMLFE